MYIPSTIGEISDRIGSLVLCLPDMELSNSGLDMDGAYEQLEYSLRLVRKRLSDERYHVLLGMARASRQLIIDGKLKEGLFILQDMKNVLKKKV